MSLCSDGADLRRAFGNGLSNPKRRYDMDAPGCAEIGQGFEIGYFVPFASPLEVKYV